VTRDAQSASGYQRPDAAGPGQDAGQDAPRSTPAISDREQKILGIIETARGKRAKFRDEKINMAHGAGGKATQTLIEAVFVPAFGSETLGEMGDAGIVEIKGLQLAITTDSYVVKPLRFPGGSIGELAVNGTVNDLAVSGARPVALTLSLVLEPPERGAANAAVVTAVAQWLQVPRREVRMRSGRSGRTKLIELVAEITLPAPDASFT